MLQIFINHNSMSSNSIYAKAWSPPQSHEGPSLYFHLILYIYIYIQMGLTREIKPKICVSQTYRVNVIRNQKNCFNKTKKAEATHNVVSVLPKNYRFQTKSGVFETKPPNLHSFF